MSVGWLLSLMVSDWQILEWQSISQILRKPSSTTKQPLVTALLVGIFTKNRWFHTQFRHVSTLRRLLRLHTMWSWWHGRFEKNSDFDSTSCAICSLLSLSIHLFGRMTHRIFVIHFLRFFVASFFAGCLDSWTLEPEIIFNKALGLNMQKHDEPKEQDQLLALVGY